MVNRRRPRSAGEANSASMSAIAFLLLIFFLVTTIFAVEKGLPMLPPGDAPAKKVKRNNILTIRTHASGAVTIDNTQVVLGQIRPIVEQSLATNEKLIIVLEAHRDSEYRILVSLLDELRLAKARRITLREISGSKSAS